MSKHLFPDRNGLRNVEEVRKLKEAFLSSLQRELALNPPLEPVQGDVGICDLLVNKCTTLRLDPHPNSIVGKSVFASGSLFFEAEFS